MQGFYDPVVACTVALLVGACGGSASNPRVANAATEHGSPVEAPTRVSIPRTIVTADTAQGVDELFEQGQRAFGEQRWKRAAAAFERVAELDPDGPLATRAAFHAAWAHDNAAEHRAALEGYEGVVRRADDDALRVEAAVRALRLLLYLDEYQRAGVLADRLLADDHEMGDVRTLVVTTAKALSLLERVEDERAERFIERGRAIVERLGLDRAGRVHRDVAQLYFALGELRRVRSEAVRLTPDVERFAAVLEARCQLLLDAQNAYSGAMRAHDAHWSAKAGYRVGELYQKLHSDLMNLRRPAAALEGSKARLFEGAMRLRYAILLEKGLRMMEHTLAMAERAGEASAWIERAGEAKARIEKAIEVERQAIDALPYSRQELERALEHLARKASKAPLRSTPRRSRTP